MSRRFGGGFDVDALTTRVEELDELSGAPGFWSDQGAAKVVLREKSGIERQLRDFASLDSALEDAETLLDLGEEEDDDATMAEGSKALGQLVSRVRAYEIRRLLGEEADESDAVLEINAGAGGTDAADWADMLKRMYLRWADRNGFKASVVDEQMHEEAGIKSCSIEIHGEYAYGYLKAEIGVHRLVRISPFDAQARRHTAFASVAAYPDVDDDIEVDIKESDLRIDTFRSSGAGGQHVNTTDSAVRITHLPTNIAVVCRSERSQHKNKSTAMKHLRARLYQHELQKRQQEVDAANAEKSRIEWGSQIRSYVLQPYRMVKDMRTGHEMGDADRVLDGDIHAFMEAWLMQRAGLSEVKEA